MNAYQRRIGEYKTAPYTRKALDSWRVLCVSQKELDRADEIEKAFDAEDREQVAAAGFLGAIRELCRATIARLRGKP